jgi:hypothetical protein
MELLRVAVFDDDVPAIPHEQRGTAPADAYFAFTMASIICWE